MTKPIPGAIALALATGAISVPSHARTRPSAAPTLPAPRHIVETPEGFVIMNRRVEAPLDVSTPALVPVGANLHLDAALLGGGRENVYARH